MFEKVQKSLKRSEKVFQTHQMKEKSMNTKLITQNIRISNWNDTIQRRIESGMSVETFCIKNGMSRNKSYYWLHKCKAGALKECPEAFVEVIPPVQYPKAEVVHNPAPHDMAVSGQFIPDAVVEINGMKISVRRQTPKELLVMLIEVSQNA